MIIIDTDVLIEVFDKMSGKGDTALKKIEDSGEDIAITSLSLHEILYGIYKYGKGNLEELRNIETVGFDQTDAVLSAELELESEQKGKTISRIDSMIAAIVMNRNAKLYTFNKKHFNSIPGLKML